MAEGKICPECGSYMYALDEIYLSKGDWIKYQCINQKCKKIVEGFEKSKNPIQNKDQDNGKKKE
jgi:hypothetical protein